MISFGSTWQPFENGGYGCFQGIPTDKLEAPQPVKGEIIYWLDESHDTYIPNLLEISEYEKPRARYGDLPTINSLLKPLNIGREKREVLTSSNYNIVTPPTSSEGFTATVGNSSGASHDFISIMDNSPSAPVHSPWEQNYNSAIHSSPRTAPKYTTQEQRELPKPSSSKLTVVKAEIELQRERNERFHRLWELWPEQPERLDWGTPHPDLKDRFKPVKEIHRHECTKDCYVPGAIISVPNGRAQPLSQRKSATTGRNVVRDNGCTEDKQGNIPTKDAIEPVGVRDGDREYLTSFFNLISVHQGSAREGQPTPSRRDLEGTDKGDNPSQGYEAWSGIMKAYPIPTRTSTHIITLSEIASFDVRKIEKKEMKAPSRPSSTTQQAFSYFTYPPYGPHHKRAGRRTNRYTPTKSRDGESEDSTRTLPNLIPDIPFSFDTCKIWPRSCPHRQPTDRKPWNNFPTPKIFVHDQKPNITAEETPKELVPRPKHSSKTDRFASVVEKFHWLESQLPWYKITYDTEGLEKAYPTPSKVWCDSIKNAKLKELKLLYAGTFPCEQREITVDGKAKSEYWRLESECRHQHRDWVTDMVDERDASLRSQDGEFVEDNLLGVKRRYILKQVCQTMGRKGMAYFKGHGRPRQYTESKQKQDDGRAPMMYFPSLQMLQGLS